MNRRSLLRLLASIPFVGGLSKSLHAEWWKGAKVTTEISIPIRCEQVSEYTWRVIAVYPDESWMIRTPVIH